MFSLQTEKSFPMKVTSDGSQFLDPEYYDAHVSFTPEEWLAGVLCAGWCIAMACCSRFGCMLYATHKGPWEVARLARGRRVRERPGLGAGPYYCNRIVDLRVAI